ncbi:MAG: Mur ligase family protein [Chromatiaceae bacterium]|jgi:cyanophycin synthetase|nr:Mur ligase family protein [Chromatiaceae bacterium]
MDILRTRLLGGPNVWADHPIAEVWLDLSGLPTDELPDLARRIRGRLGALVGRSDCPRRISGGGRVRQCLWLARCFAWTTVELATGLGRRPSFSRTRLSPEPDVVLIALSHEDSDVPEAWAETALRVFRALRADPDSDLSALIDELRANAARARPSRTAAAMIQAAKARGIPVHRVGADVLRLGQGIHQRRLCGTRSDRTSPVGDWAAADRDLLQSLLASAGLPCTDEPPPAPQHRLLVAGGRLVAALHAQPAPDGLGESPVEVSELVHPELAARLVDASQALGLDVAEVRVAAADLTQPLEAQGGQVCEVIPAPPLDRYLDATPQRPIPERVLEAIFPPRETGRVPVLAVTGTNGKTTVTRFLAHALSLTGRFVGMTCTDGIFLAGRCIDADDCSGPRSARLVLANPRVEAAVLETARGGILREGLGFDLCDLAVITNIGEGDHLGLGGITTLQGLAEVKQTVVRSVAPWGTAVLNAADPLVARMASRSRGRVLFFARDGAHPLLRRHRRSGGRVAFVRDQALILAQGAEERPPLPLSRIPLTHDGRVGFQVENVLAGAGALWAFGLPHESLALALETFGANLDQAPGRFNMLELGGTTVVVDYGHNPSALLAMVDALSRFPHRRRTAVYSAAGDRRDIDMIRQGEILGQAFDQVILYEDHYTRGRLPGEIMALFRRGLAAGQRVQQVQPIHGWRNAVDAALWLAQPGDLLMIQADQIGETVAYVRERLAADARREPPPTLGLATGTVTTDQALVPACVQA